MDTIAKNFVLLDNPRIGRAALAGSTVLLGLVLSVMAWWSLHICVVPRLADQLGLAFGIALAVGGCVWWLAPIRAPRVILRANRECVQFANDLPVKTDTQYNTIFWPNIREVTAIEHGDGYAICIESKLPDNELASIKKPYGPSYIGTIHSSKQYIPVFVLSLKGAKKIATAIKNAEERPMSISADKSNAPLAEGRRESTALFD